MIASVFHETLPEGPVCHRPHATTRGAATPRKATARKATARKAAAMTATRDTPRAHIAAQGAPAHIAAQGAPAHIAAQGAPARRHNGPRDGTATRIDRNLRQGAQ